MYVFVCITRSTSWALHTTTTVSQHRQPNQASNQAIECSRGSQHVMRRDTVVVGVSLLSRFFLLITPQFAMLDLHTTRFIHDHDSSWHDKLIRRRFDEFAVPCAYASISLSRCVCRSVCHFQEFTHFEQNVAFCFISLTSSAFAFLSCCRRRFCCVSLCFIEVRLICSLLLVVLVLFLLSLLFCLFCVLKFSRLFVVHWSHTMCLKIVFSLVLFLVSSWCVLTYYSYIGRYVLFIYFTSECVMCAHVCVPHCVDRCSFVHSSCNRYVCVRVRAEQMLPVRECFSKHKTLFLHISRRLMCKQYAIECVCVCVHELGSIRGKGNPSGF